MSAHRELTLAITRSISRLFRTVTIVGLGAAVSMAIGVGYANAGETLTDVETASGATLDEAPAALRIDGIEFGLGALAQMKRERSEHRRVPRMLPLLATSRTVNGQVWFGLARSRGVSPSSSLRLELCWTIPIGR
jgi:hypothetical protein